jgi:hypothetical protein
MSTFNPPFPIKWALHSYLFLSEVEHICFCSFRPEAFKPIEAQTGKHAIQKPTAGLMDNG